ncbi:MAG: hypothetical protein IKZ88_02540 [Neisseriaceae bacterium]|nr:hypothetical protein [Neisseriaceae bacterium]
MGILAHQNDRKPFRQPENKIRVIARFFRRKNRGNPVLPDKAKHNAKGVVTHLSLCNLGNLNGFLQGNQNACGVCSNLRFELDCHDFSCGKISQ